jgi:hypothetical protein
VECGLELEEAVVRCTLAILREAAGHRLKAVELANTLRVQLGTDALAQVRCRCGGLLTLLDRHPHLFHVERVPKSDVVALIGGPHSHPSAVLGPVGHVGSAAAGSQEELGVLGLLTTERCVPTQAWPAGQKDWPYVRIMSELLFEAGGGCTISKLRSLLKGRLNSLESIKSVPLKAFLVAYGETFVITANRVTLARRV